MNNVVIFVLSPFVKKDIPFNDFTDITGIFHAKTKQTNESCLKYLIWKLGQEGQTLNKAYAFVTPDSMKNGDFEQFQSLFPDLPIDHIILSKGLVQDAMQTVPQMHDKLIEYRKEHDGTAVRISVDITGGFRHASMMMLPLIQLLRYSGFSIGDIIYANNSVTPKIIEDASDLLNFTSLIGGAEEFVSLGSIKQIQKYFSNTKPSIRLQNLLDRMTDLSEILRVCGSYQITENALMGLNDAINIYETSLQKEKEVDAQEMYFSKLLPRIKQEYQDVLPQRNKPITPEGIIRWCLHKELFQQAVTFYTEWLPRFLIESNRIYVKDKDIVTECKEKGVTWSHWSIYLLRYYQPQNFESYSISKAGWRKDVFQYMLKIKTITTSLHPSKLLNFIERYDMIVTEIRNKFAHAKTDTGIIEGKKDIIEAIEESLTYIAGKQ